MFYVFCFFSSLLCAKIVRDAQLLLDHKITLVLEAGWGCKEAESPALVDIGGDNAFFCFMFCCVFVCF